MVNIPSSSETTKEQRLELLESLANLREKAGAFLEQVLREEAAGLGLIREVSNMVMEKSGLECALDLAAKSPKGIPWHITREWAEQLIREHGLKLECGAGDMSGEGHALFPHNGQTIRLKRDWMGKFMLYHGEWEHDPHWAGD